MIQDIKRIYLKFRLFRLQVELETIQQEIKNIHRLKEIITLETRIAEYKKRIDETRIVEPAAKSKKNN